jgi:hypothetical protein
MCSVGQYAQARWVVPLFICGLFNDAANISVYLIISRYISVISVYLSISSTEHRKNKNNELCRVKEGTFACFKVLRRHSLGENEEKHAKARAESVSETRTRYLSDTE